ncbi:unnamed protein product [Protopolystoma xenopodis]|uniref:Uncharacterized protein n=1 Tax=Protopolystoma xenopodis TaxID=117903 RepID=A0A448XPX1_9PLAT|nr:unnamed protein product [Protopolystoma xenopodis]
MLRKESSSSEKRSQFFAAKLSTLRSPHEAVCVAFLKKLTISELAKSSALVFAGSLRDLCTSAPTLCVVEATMSQYNAHGSGGISANASQLVVLASLSRRSKDQDGRSHIVQPL